MAKRVIIRPGFIRVSRPGYDVDTASERDLLLSLGARNNQIIQRGQATMTLVNQAGAINTYQSNVWFPTQATAPDFWFGITTSVVTNDGTTYTVVSYTDHLFVEVKVVSATLTTVPYLIFRKRLSG